MDNCEKYVSACEHIIAYNFHNKLLALEALQTTGYRVVWENKWESIRKNENLAVLGDVVLKAHLVGKWYRTGRPKRDWTTIEQAIVANSSLTTVGYAKGLNECIILNPGTRKVSDKTMATTVEAILGATYLDGGDEALADVLVSLGLGHEFLTVEVPMTTGQIDHIWLEGVLLSARFIFFLEVMQSFLGTCRSNITSIEANLNV